MLESDGRIRRRDRKPIDQLNISMEPGIVQTSQLLAVELDRDGNRIHRKNDCARRARDHREALVAGCNGAGVNSKECPV